MAETYCGKSCESCTQKEQKLCPGCHAGPGRSWSGDCEIAVCCRDKGHDTCDTCTNSRYCGKYRRRDEMPERRARKLAEKAEKEAELARKAPFLTKWLRLLFWLVIPGTVASLLSMDAVADWAPGVYLFGTYLGVVCTLLYGLILLRMVKENESYRTAGILRLVTAGVSLLLALVAGNGTGANWTLLISLPGAVVGLVATYQEYMAHADLVQPVDAGQAEKWRRLWKWYVGCLIATIASVLVIMIFSLLGLLVMLAGAIGVLVVDIVCLVYIYQMAQTFRTYIKT